MDIHIPFHSLLFASQGTYKSVNVDLAACVRLITLDSTQQGPQHRGKDNTEDMYIPKTPVIIWICVCLGQSMLLFFTPSSCRLRQCIKMVTCIVDHYLGGRYSRLSTDTLSMSKTRQPPIIR